MSYDKLKAVFEKPDGLEVLTDICSMLEEHEKITGQILAKPNATGAELFRAGGGVLALKQAKQAFTNLWGLVNKSDGQ